jgi:predicted PurR-regulated permease PerM
MRTDHVLRALFIALFALTLYLMYRIFVPFLPGIAWAVVLVVAFQPVHARLVRLARGRAWLVSIGMSLALASLIVVPTVIAVVKVGQGLVDGYAWLEQSYVESGPDLGIAERAPWAKDAIEFVERYVDLKTIDVKAMALSTLKTAGNALAGKSAALVANAVQTILTFIVLLVTMAVLFNEGGRLLETVQRLLPLSETDRVEVLDKLRAVTRSVFFGVLFTALLQGALGAIGVAITGLPSPITFGAAMFFCALLPGGTVMVWGPAALWLLASGHPWKALFLFLWGALVVSLADNVVRPLFISRGVQMHTLLVFFGIFGGMLAFGLVGLFIGPLVITLFLVLIDVARRDMLRDALDAPAPKG